MPFEKDHPSLSEGDYELDIPGGVMSCTASQLGLRPGDYDDPRYREAYKRVMIISETDDDPSVSDDGDFAFVSVGQGGKSLNLLNAYLEKYGGADLERMPLLELRDGRYVLRARHKLVEQMGRLGFDVKPYDIPRRANHERP